MIKANCVICGLDVHLKNEDVRIILKGGQLVAYSFVCPKCGIECGQDPAQAKTLELLWNAGCTLVAEGEPAA